MSLIREVVHSLAHWLQFPLDLAELRKGINGKLEVLETMRQPGSADGFVGISQTIGSPKTQGLVWVSFLNKAASHSISDLTIAWASKETVTGEHFIANARSLFQLRGTSQGSFWIFRLRPLDQETKIQGRCSEQGWDTTPNSGSVWRLNTFTMTICITENFVCMVSGSFLLPSFGCLKEMLHKNSNDGHYAREI